MSNASEQGRDAMRSATQSFGAAFRGGGEGYVRYVWTVQQELLQLSLNLLQREIATGQKVASSRDLGETFAAYHELMNETMHDFATASARLFEHTKTLGSVVAQNTKQGMEGAAKGTEESVKAAAGQVSRITEEAGRNAAEVMSHTTRQMNHK